MLLRRRRSAAFDCVECGACPTSGDSVNDFQQRQRRSNHLKCVAPPMAPVLQVRAATKGGLRKARPGIGDVSRRHVLSQCTVALQRLVVHLRRFYGRSGAARPPLPVRSACEPGVARDDDHRKKSKKKTPTTAGRRAFLWSTLNLPLVTTHAAQCHLLAGVPPDTTARETKAGTKSNAPLGIKRRV